MTSLQSIFALVHGLVVDWYMESFKGIFEIQLHETNRMRNFKVNSKR